jgi:D-3-phosphoglycerate dehydrogenase / 2-oxoglutarate reductase
MGRRVMVLGYGRIGREVARRCAAFDMQVSVYDPYVQANVIEQSGYRSVPDFAAVLPETDILTVHMPLAAESRHLIGKAELAELPSHALVINCARGGIVDEDALHAALTSGKIAGAGIDVFEQEPPPESHPLFGLDNVLLSPHTAGMSQEAAIRMAISTVRNALAGIDGKLDPSMVVNREVL